MNTIDPNDDLLSADFQIEEIVSHKTKQGKTRYFIKWLGYPESENTWEFESDLIADGCSTELRKYDALNLNSAKKPRRRRVKPKLFRTKPGQLTPSGRGRSVELKRRIKSRKDKIQHAQDLKLKIEAEAKAFRIPPSSYFLTRTLFLRSLSLVYFTAFLVAYDQNPGLIGDTGLLPAKNYWKQLNSTYQSNYPWDGLKHSPSLLWFLPNSDIASTIQLFAQIGMTISLLIFCSGRANAVLLFSLWSLYFSIDGVGQRWYSFGWESQLLETGFLAIFVSPFLSLRHNDIGSGGWAVVWGYRWLIFRILLGAGLIKVRGDQCWRDLTCMDYHYETQPVPGPTSRWYHQNPQSFHILETGSNHVIELIVPFMMFMGRTPRIISGVFQICFQFILISSGNLAFLNWLTILPSIYCLDDAFLMDFVDFICKNVCNTCCVPSIVSYPIKSILRFAIGYQNGMATKKELYFANVKKVKEEQEEKNKKQQRKNKSNSGTEGSSNGSATCTTYIYGVISLILGCVITYESVPVVNNLLALNGQQAMNTNFNVWKIVNTYGAFGSITKERTEIILEGTLSTDPTDSNAIWLPYEFKIKPGALDRMPRWITPYHYRLDWLMWFAAFSSYQQHPWLLHLTSKLLVNDPLASSLLASNPFLEQKMGPPKFIRAEHYIYKYSDSTDSMNWWQRERKGEYFPPIELSNPSLQKFLIGHGWNVPVLEDMNPKSTEGSEGTSKKKKKKKKKQKKRK